MSKLDSALEISRKYGACITRRLERRVAALRICCVTNKPYWAMYQVLPAGKYKLSGYVSNADSGLGSSSAGTVAQIPFDAIVGRWLNPERCPHCKAKSLVQCGLCEQFVCSGRVEGDHFRCADSCGFEAILGGYLSSFEGSVSEMPSLGSPLAVKGIGTSSRRVLLDGRR